MSEIFDLAKSLGGEVFEDMKTSLESSWDGLTQEQQDTVKKVGLKVVEYRLKVKIDPTNADLKGKLETWESAVLDWKAWGEMGLEDAFWKRIARVGSALGSFLGSVAGEAISRIVPGL